MFAQSKGPTGGRQSVVADCVVPVLIELSFSGSIAVHSNLHVASSRADLVIPISVARSISDSDLDPTYIGPISMFSGLSSIISFRVNSAAECEAVLFKMTVATGP